MEIIVNSASLDVPLLSLSDPADAWPAILLHRGEIFQAIEVGRDARSFLMGSFLTDGVGLVDIVDASNLKIVGAVMSSSENGE
jgi:hypothetical protein